MKIRKLFLIPLLALSFLTGCDPKTPPLDKVVTTAEILELASQSGSILINGTTGVAYSDRSQDIIFTKHADVSKDEHLLGSRSLVVKNLLLEEEGEKTNVKVAISYSVDEDTASFWTITEKKPDADHDRLKPKFPKVDESEYRSVITATFKLYYEEDEEVLDDTEFKASWNVLIRPMQVIE